MCLINNVLNYHVRLTTFFYGSDHAEYTRKTAEDESKRHKKGRFVQTEINSVLGKNGGHTTSSLGSRLIGVVRQVGRQYSCSLKFLKLTNLIIKHI